MDPVTAAWTATGSPRPEGPTRAGECARCLAPEHLTLTSKVVSDNFTAYGDWLNPQGYGLCPACAWTYTHAALRAHPHLVRREPPTLAPLDPVQLYRVLQQPPTLDVTLSVPSRAGRKHVLPLARWGRIQFDDAQITWTIQDVHRLSVLTTLRQAGASTSSLMQAAPPWAVLRAVPDSSRAQFLTQWDELQPWRTSRPWLQIALMATAPT